MRRLSRLALLGLTLAGTHAWGARRPFVVAYDTSTLAEGDVEIESWLDFVSNRNGKAPSSWLWWIGPRWAPIEAVEVAALTIFQQDFTNPAKTGTPWAQLWAELVEGHWRMLEGSLGSLAVQVKVRVPIASDLPWHLGSSLIWSAHASRLNWTAQVAYARGLPNRWGPSSDSYQLIDWAGGVTVTAIKGEVTPLLQVGVEGFGQAVLQGQNDLSNGSHTANVGPTLAVAKGRLWASAGYLIGLTGDSPSPFFRAVIGVSL